MFPASQWVMWYLTRKWQRLHFQNWKEPPCFLMVALSASVSWTDPASDFDHVLVRFFQGTPPTLPSSGELAYVGGGTSAHLTGLDRSKPLGVAVFPVDAAGNVGARVTSQA